MYLQPDTSFSERQLLQKDIHLLLLQNKHHAFDVPRPLMENAVAGGSSRESEDKEITQSITYLNIF